MTDITPEDRDILIRTVIGEANKEPDDGKAAVAHVVLNRMASGKYGGSGLQDVVFAKNQFEPWMTRANELRAISVDSDAYRNAAGVVDKVLTGQTPDPTQGSTHFLNPDVVRNRNPYATSNGLPAWAAGQGNRIGNHVFFSPEGAVPADKPRATISYDDMTVPQVTPTVSQAVAETERAAHREQTAPSLWTGIKDAVSSEWIINTTFGDAAPARVALPDPNWTYTPEQFKLDTQKLPKDLWPALADAHSDEHRQWLLARMDEKVQAHDRLSQLGWTGTGLQLAASLLDPSALAIAVATEGAAASVLVPAKAGRLGTILGRAASGAAAGTAVVGAKDASDLETHSPAEYLMGAGIGVALGGTLGAMHRGLPSDTAGRIVDVGNGMTRDGQAIADAAGVAPGSVGAAKAPRADFFLDDDKLASIHNGDIPESALNGRWRVDSAGDIDRSGIPLARALGNALLEDGVGKKGGSITGVAAELEMRRFYQAEAGKLARAEHAFFGDWSKDMGWAEKKQRVGEFFETVGRYVRDPDSVPDAHEAVKKMAAQYQQFYAERLKLQQNPLRDRGIEGRPVAGADGIPTNKQYLPRIADDRRVRSLIDRYSAERIEQLVGGAIRSAQPDLDEKLIEKMGRGWVRRRMQNAYGLQEDPKFAFLSNDLDAIRATLKNDYDLADADIADVIAKLPKRENAGGKDAHFKQRIDLDEGFSTKLQPKFGGPAEEVHFTDLLVNDASKLTDIYNRRTAGRVSMARVRIKGPEGDLVVNGITKDSEFESLVTNMKRQAADMERDGHAGAVKKAETAEKNLRWAYDMILGRPVESQIGAFAEFSRYVRKFNFARLMNVMGFNQIQEASNIAGQAGMKAMFQQMPSLRRIRDMDAGLIRKHGLEEELEAVMGLGSEELRSSRFHRWDEYGADYRTGRSQLAHNVDNALDVAGDVTRTISGFKYVNEFTQVWAARAAAQKFANLAGNPTKANLKRMASLGLDEAQLGKVLEQIKTHSSLEDGVLFGGKLKKLNLDKWSDLDSRVAFENALFRWSRRLIQENDYGSMARWMSHPLAQMILQFRAFISHGWAKQFLHNVHMRDWNTFTTFAHSMMAGAAVYMVQERLRAIGRQDSDAYLQKRLAPTKIAAASFARAGWSSFIPTMIDSAITPFGAKPIFDTRTSAQQSDLWLGNPAFGLLDDTSKMLKGMFSPSIEKRARTAEDTRNIVRPLIWQNALPVTILMNYLTRGMPDRPAGSSGR